MTVEILSKSVSSIIILALLNFVFYNLIIYIPSNFVRNSNIFEIFTVFIRSICLYGSVKYVSSEYFYFLIIVIYLQRHKQSTSQINIYGQLIKIIMTKSVNTNNVNAAVIIFFMVVYFYKTTHEIKPGYTRMSSLRGLAGNWLYFPISG